MASKLIEIQGTYLSEFNRFQNPDGDVVLCKVFVNSDINAPVTFKGQADPDELNPGSVYLWSGDWTTYKNRNSGKTERQFAFTAFVEQAPHDRQAVIAYLCQHGEGHGVSTGRAGKLFDFYGSDAVRMVRESPEQAALDLDTAGLPVSLENMRAIAAKLAQQVEIENCMMEMIGILAGRGFPKTLAKQVVKDRGSAAARDVRRNPFVLLKYHRVGFKLCDELWKHLGKRLNAIKRQAYCLWNAIDNDPDGSTWVAQSAAEFALRKSIGVRELNPAKAVRLAVRGGLLSEIKTRGNCGPIADDGSITWLAVREKAAQEAKLAELVAAAMSEPHRWPDVSLIPNIDGEQPEQLSLALRGSVAILGGRPGVGKTFVAANLVRVLVDQHGEYNLGIGAPTNLAAQRLNQAMAEYKVNARARTNHSLLGRPKVRGKQWRHDEDNPLPFSILMFDEESMKDTNMMCSIFRARAKGTMVLLIGDINQLPPIDHGAPLRDMIAAGLPYGELKQIRRNSGGIVEACAAIAENKPWRGGDNLEIIEAGDDEQNAIVLQKLAECREAGFDPIWDTRVIVAKNDTRRELNKLLQGELNPREQIAGSPFRIDDKVICRENADFAIVEVDRGDQDVEFNDRGDSVRVANGELGRVLELHDGHLIVKLSAPDRVVRVPRKPVPQVQEESDKTGTGCAFDLAYAVTYHSSQGSEFPWPILVARSGDARMGSRELVYTGISRGKVKCKMIGRKAVWNKFCENVALRKRKTLLKERILLERAKIELESL